MSGGNSVCGGGSARAAVYRNGMIPGRHRHALVLLLYGRGYVMLHLLGLMRRRHPGMLRGAGHSIPPTLVSHVLLLRRHTPIIVMTRLPHRSLHLRLHLGRHLGRRHSWLSRMRMLRHPRATHPRRHLRGSTGSVWRSGTIAVAHLLTRIHGRPRTA